MGLLEVSRKNTEALYAAIGNRVNSASAEDLVHLTNAHFKLGMALSFMGMAEAVAKAYGENGIEGVVEAVMEGIETNERRDLKEHLTNLARDKKKN